MAQKARSRKGQKATRRRVKVLFLDIDGVLVSTDNSLSWHPSYGERASVDNQYRDHFDPRCVNWLKGIVNLTGCKIIISSTWRNRMEDKPTGKFERMWRRRKMPDVVIGATPHIFKKGKGTVKRGYEIRLWLQSQKQYKVTHYCIIDDGGDMLREQRKNFVQTNSDIGLTEESFSKAIKILGLRRDLPLREKRKYRIWTEQPHPIYTR